MFIMVANCRRIVKNNKINEVKSYVKEFYVIFSTKTIYSCLFLLIVPSILCETDKHRNLTYEEIYKNTQYAQIHNYTPRPHNRVNKSQNINVTKSEDFEGNEVEDEIDGLLSKSTLLVGFARDPYRYSIPEDDYMKGVRYMEPPVFPNKGDIRGKRGVVHLYNMLTCATGCDPLSYKGYGCYCGFLGAGRPTDGIDRCCKMHDQCYENIYCPFYTVYFQPYYWKCYHGEPLCALENWQTRHQFVNGCAGRLCECDRLFAMCVRRFSCPRGRALCRSSPIRLLQNVLMLR